MKKKEILEKLKKTGILDEDIKLSCVSFENRKQIDLDLIGNYESYSSSVCTYSAYNLNYVADEKLDNIIQLPHFIESTSGYAHDIPTKEGVTEIDIAEALSNIDFKVKYIINVNKSESCQSYPEYIVTIYNNIDEVIKKRVKKVNEVMQEDF